MSDHIDSVTGEWDEDGYHLRIVTDEGEHEFLVTDTTVAREILRSVAPLHEWEGEERLERAAYDRASPEERDRVLGRAPAHLDCGVDRERIAELRRVATDHRRKTEQEDR